MQNDYDFRKMVRFIVLLSYVPIENVHLEFENMSIYLFGMLKKFGIFLLFCVFFFLKKTYF